MRGRNLHGFIGVVQASTALMIAILVVAAAGTLLGTRTADAAVPISEYSYPVGENPKGINASDCTGDGIPDLIVANQNSNDVTTLANAGDGTFSFANTNQVGTQPTGAACGDFNGDGLIDVAATSRNAGTVSIYRRNLDETYSLLGSVSVGFVPTSLASADLNNDGNLDLLIVNSGSHDLTVLYGTGTDTLPLISTIRLPTTSPRAVAVEDFNEDGHLDIAVAADTEPSAAILLGNGVGFQALDDAFPPGPTTRRPPKAHGVAAAHLNNDTHPDLAVLSTNATVSFFLGVGNGTFMLDHAVVVTPDTEAIILALLNDDAFPDLAFLNSSSNNASVLLATGAGQFPLPAGLASQEVANTPGLAVPRTALFDPIDPTLTRTQVVALSPATPALQLLQMDDPDVLTETRLATLTEEPQTLVLADLTSDTIADAVIIARARRGAVLQVLRGNPAGGFDPPPLPSGACGNGILETAELCDDGNVAQRDGCSPTCAPEIGRGVASIAATDLDADGLRDLVLVDGRNTVVVLKGDGQGHFSAVRRVTKIRPRTPAAVADFTGDGIPDIAVIPRKRGEGSITILANDGVGNLTPTPIAIPNVRVTGPLLAVDLDRDGYMDLAAGAKGGWVGLFNDGTGPRRGGAINASPKVVRAFAAADFDEDGWLDVVATIRSTATPALLYRGSANGTFDARETIVDVPSFTSVAIADINDDLHQDLLLCDVEAIPTCSGRFGDGTGGFTAAAFAAGPTAMAFAVGRDVRGVAAADLDDDGIIDFVGVSRRDRRVVVMFRDLAGQVTNRVALVTGASPRNVSIGDLDGDGRPDIVAVNEDSSDLSVFLNRGGEQFDTLAPIRLPEGGRFGTALALADLNDDGRLDVVVSQAASKSATPTPEATPTTTATSTDSVEPTTEPTLTATPTPTPTGMPLPSDVALLLNLGGGGFANAGQVLVGSMPQDVVVAALNGDSTPDIVTANRDGNSITVLLSGAGGYTRADLGSGGLQPSSLAAGDLDGDGDVDLVVGNEKMIGSSKVGGIATFLNDGSGTFALGEVRVRGRETPRDICLGDFDGDQLLDVAAASIETSDILILFGSGDGTWRSDEREYPVGGRPVAVFCADLDDDTLSDVLFGRRKAADVNWVGTGS